MCKENGPWIICDSDRYGFNNYDKIWNNDNLFSYVIGDCLHTVLVLIK